MNPRLASLVFGLAALGSAQASPVTALSCVSPATKTFATVGIRTGFFAPSTQEILEYSVTLGKLAADGEVASRAEYEIESNLKIFDNASQAYAWVKANTVVIPLAGGKKTNGSILVDLAKKRVTVIDTDYETAETLDCIVN